MWQTYHPEQHIPSRKSPEVATDLKLVLNSISVSPSFMTNCPPRWVVSCSTMGRSAGSSSSPTSCSIHTISCHCSQPEICDKYDDLLCNSSLTSVYFQQPQCSTDCCWFNISFECNVCSLFTNEFLTFWKVTKYGSHTGTLYGPDFKVTKATITKLT